MRVGLSGQQFPAIPQSVRSPVVCPVQSSQCPCLRVPGPQFDPPQRPQFVVPPVSQRSYSVPCPVGSPVVCERDAY